MRLKIARDQLDPNQKLNGRRAFLQNPGLKTRIFKKTGLIQMFEKIGKQQIGRLCLSLHGPFKTYCAGVFLKDDFFELPRRRNQVAPLFQGLSQ
mgnify:CR=1 FL=1